MVKINDDTSLESFVARTTSHQAMIGVKRGLIFIIIMYKERWLRQNIFTFFYVLTFFLELVYLKFSLHVVLSTTIKLLNHNMMSCVAVCRSSVGKPFMGTVSKCNFTCKTLLESHLIAKYHGRIAVPDELLLLSGWFIQILNVWDQEILRIRTKSWVWLTSTSNDTTAI